MMDRIQKMRKTLTGLYKMLLILFYFSSFYAVVGLSKLIDLGKSEDIDTSMILSFIYIIILVAMSKIFGGYKIGHYRIQEVIYYHILSLILTDIIIVMVLFLIIQHYFSIGSLIMLTLVQIFVVIVWAYIGNKIYFMVNKPFKMLMIYGKLPKSLLHKFMSRPDKYNICKAINDEAAKEDIEKDMSRYQTIILYEVDNNVKANIIEYCFENNKNVYMIPTVSDIIASNVEKIDLFDTPIFVVNNKGLSIEQKLFKRILDLLLIVPICLVAFPFMVLTAAVIKLYDKGPVFYKQERLTYNGKHFYVYKFRSMKIDAEKESGARLASKNDNRITPVGKVIRAIRFDELPQIINILKGEMSIVGPRPERPEIAEEYMESYPEFSYRLKVKAGLTGYAQILGKYNTSPIDKVKLDLIYIQNYSMLMDLKLILMTIKILFMPESTEGVEEGVKLTGQ